MSEENFIPQAGLDTPVSQVAAATSSEPLTVIVPSGALNTQTWTTQAWFYPYLPQTFAGAVSNGIATPTVSGNGYLGQVNTGFVFQNAQYNSRREGSGQ
jgi:hypothetical protein